MSNDHVPHQNSSTRSSHKHIKQLWAAAQASSRASMVSISKRSRHSSNDGNNEIIAAVMIEWLMAENF